MAAVIGVYLVCGVLAIAGIEAQRPWLLRLFKPLTTALLVPIIGWPHTPYARLVVAGAVLSIAGDAALLFPGNGAFMVGLSIFLLAHAAYIAGFVHVAIWSPATAVVGLVVAAISAWSVSKMWRGAGSLRGPVIAYGAVITAMVTTASATPGGPLAGGAWMAAGGAVLFYISDSSLGLDQFHRRIPHVAYLTLGVYWLGQLGIALSARRL